MQNGVLGIIILDQGFTGYFNGHFVVGMTGIDLEKDPSLEHANAAGDVFKPESKGTVIQFFKIRLNDTGSVVVEAEIHVIAADVLSKVYETGITVFDDVVDQFLDNAEDQ